MGEPLDLSRSLVPLFEQILMAVPSPRLVEGRLVTLARDALIPSHAHADEVPERPRLALTFLPPPPACLSSPFTRTHAHGSASPGSPEQGFCTRAFEHGKTGVRKRVLTLRVERLFGVGQRVVGTPTNDTHTHDFFANLRPRSC